MIFSESSIKEKLITRLVKKQTKIENKVERLFMTTNLKTTNYVDTFIDVIKDLKRIYGDGFQYTDLIQTLAITPKFISLAKDYNDVKSEYFTLSNEQIIQLTNEKLDDLVLSIYKPPVNPNDKYGIVNLVTVLEELNKMLNVSIQAAKNGIDLTDVVYLVPISISIVNIIDKGEEAIKELTNLDLSEFTQIFAMVLGKVLNQIRN